MEHINTIDSLQENSAAISLKKKFDFDKRLFFTFLCLFLFANSYLLNEFIMTRDVFFRSYGERIAAERIEEMLSFMANWRWLGYIFIPLFLVVKIGFAAVCLNIGTLLGGFKIGFARIFKIALVAESILTLATFSRNLTLLFNVEENTMEGIQQFYPLSLMNLVNPSEIPPWTLYPLQALNFFEVAYWFALAMGLSLVLKEKKKKMFSLVMSSYGVGFLIWMVFIMFLSINLS